MSEDKFEFELRYSEEADAQCLKTWLSDEEIIRWFPCQGEAEIDDTVRMVAGFSKWKCSITATVDGKPIGIAVLFLHAYKKIAHQSLFAIIVDKEYRNKGVGAQLLKNLEHLAKTQFKLTVLHLEVFEGNPAISLYRRAGFTEAGYNKYWIREDDGNYLAKINMEKVL